MFHLKVAKEKKNLKIKIAVFSYSLQVLPYFRLFQESRHVPRVNGFYEYPRCYKAIQAEQMECLIFQDLAESRFIMIDKNDLTVEHILLVMKLIGKFHAISFALKDQQPEKFEEIASGLHEPMFKANYILENSSIALNSAAINAINSITDEKDAHLLEALLKLYEKTQYEIILECIDADLAEPYAVITHGDMWSNNTMFRVDDDNKPKRAYLIDWQLVKLKGCEFFKYYRNSFHLYCIFCCGVTFASSSVDRHDMRHQCSI